MSNALFLAAVTALLKNLLENGLVARGVTANIGADVTISAQPPDRIKTGDDERPQINLYLYRVKWKGLEHSGRYALDVAAERYPAAKVNLELDYLVSAYGAQDLHMEILLGYVMELLRETPLLTAEVIRNVLTTVSSTSGGKVVLPALAALATAPLGNQLQEIKIAPTALKSDETNQLWSILHATYRPSAIYKVAVVLADDEVGDETAETADTKTDNLVHKDADATKRANKVARATKS